MQWWPGGLEMVHRLLLVGVLLVAEHARELLCLGARSLQTARPKAGRASRPTEGFGIGLPSAAMQLL